MKNPKKPTRAQKQALSKAGKDWRDWGVVSEELGTATFVRCNVLGKPIETVTLPIGRYETKR